MDYQLCYFKDETSKKIQSLLTLNVVYKKGKNFPRILHWNNFTGEIPSNKKSSEAFEKFYHSKIIDQTFLEDFENENVINTKPNLAKLYPIITPSDGNCLCHAVSLYQWGVPDREHFLRQLLYITLVTDENKLLQRLYLQHMANQQHLEENFDTLLCCDQWDKLVKEAEEIPKNPNSSHLDPLEAIHIFILANILLRPIIVYCSPVIRNVFNQTIQANDIGGIYLPLLWKVTDTQKSPIILGFHMNHFVPLLYMQKDVEQVKKIPLLKDGLVNLPVHFLQEPMPNHIAKNLKAYLDVDKGMDSVLVKSTPLPKDLDVYKAHYEYCKNLYGHTTQISNDINPGIYEEDYFNRHSETIHIISESLNKEPSLCINNCGMYGSPEFGNKCSKCFSLDCTLSVKPPRESAQPKQELHFSHKNRKESLMNEPSPYMNIPESNLVQEHIPQSCRPKLFRPSKQKVSEEETRQEKFSKGLASPKCKPQIFQSRQMTEEVKPSQEMFKGHSESFESTVILKAGKPWNASALLPSQAHAQIHQQFDELSLATATCITSGCRAKGFRNLQYRCQSCFIERAKKKENDAFSENNFKTSNHLSRISENTPGFLLKQTATATNASSYKLDPVLKHTSSSEASFDDRQLSLLDLLCSNDHCPNRRISPLDPLCLSCSKLGSIFYCSTPGCPNERTNMGHDMCKDCLKRNSRQWQKTERNESKQNLDTLNSKKTQRERKCENPICFNSGATDVTEYCLKCYMLTEITDHPKPTAPEIFN